MTEVKIDIEDESEKIAEDVAEDAAEDVVEDVAEEIGDAVTEAIEDARKDEQWKMMLALQSEKQTQLMEGLTRTIESQTVMQQAMLESLEALPTILREVISQKSAVVPENPPILEVTEPEAIAQPASAPLKKRRIF